MTTQFKREYRPRRVKAKITRIVTEIAIILLDRDGNIEEIDDVHEELGWDDAEIVTTIDVLTSGDWSI